MRAVFSDFPSSCRCAVRRTGEFVFCRGAVRRTGEFVFCRGAARRTGEFVSCRGAASRTGEFAAGYAAHVPGGTASGKTDAAGSRGRIPTSGEGTDSQIPPSGSRRAGLAVCARIYVRIDPAALSPHAVLPVPASGDNVRSQICGKPAVFTPQMERGGYFCKLFCDLRC